MPFFQDIFHATEARVSLTVGVVTLAVAMAAPFIDMMAETFGRKKVIVPALFAMVVPMLPAWFWRMGGWRACVAVFGVASLISLSLALAGGKPVVFKQTEA